MLLHLTMTLFRRKWKGDTWYTMCSQFMLCQAHRDCSPRRVTLLGEALGSANPWSPKRPVPPPPRDWHISYLRVRRSDRTSPQHVVWRLGSQVAAGLSTSLETFQQRHEAAQSRDSDFISPTSLLQHIMSIYRQGQWQQESNGFRFHLNLKSPKQGTPNQKGLTTNPLD